MKITLECGTSRWFWTVEDDDDGVRYCGSAEDFIRACRAALSHFDKATKENECR